MDEFYKYIITKTDSAKKKSLQRQKEKRKKKKRKKELTRNVMRIAPNSFIMLNLYTKIEF